MDNLERWRKFNEERDEARRAAEREYNSALMDFNEGIRVARRKYDDAMEAADAKWREQLDTLEPLDNG